MVSWDGQENLQGRNRLAKFDQALGGVVFSSTQAAITAALEVLGSRFQPISVVIPVTASYNTLMAVIRANARPIVVDIDKHTLQADPIQVREVLGDVEEAVVLLTRPGGLPITSELLEIVQDVPTIVTTDVLPTELDMLCTYSVYDMSMMLGNGSVVFTKTSEVLKDLKTVRTDSQTEMSEVLATLGYKRHPEMAFLPKGLEYGKLLNAVDCNITGYGGNATSGTYLIEVSDAYRAYSVLAENGIQTALGVVPVYKYAIARKRFPQEPNYPVAEQLHTRFLLLPDHEDAPRARILDILRDL